MRFLLDENLSWRLTELLTKTGHDAIHVRALVDRHPPELAGIIAAFTQDSIRVRTLPLR
jgi:predicted nuclease of predicted toxin-antitoxin system